MEDDLISREIENIKASRRGRPIPSNSPMVFISHDSRDAKLAEAFGKLLSILLDEIEGKLSDEQELFEQLNAKLNRVQREDGTVQDDRLSEVREIEEVVQQFLQESFADVSLKINIPPEFC